MIKFIEFLKIKGNILNNYIICNYYMLARDAKLLNYLVIPYCSCIPFHSLLISY